MYLEFVSTVIMNFKAFKGRHGFALNGTGVVFVVGENRVTKRLKGNGAAKSTIWDAICWCLYGKTPLGLSTNDVKPWSGGNPSVTVLITAEERDYLCQRSTNPNRFTVNGEDRADISEVLPISFRLFINTILLPQGRELFFDLQPRDKMALIAEACDLERWDTRSKAASDAAVELDAKVDGFLNEERTTRGAIEELEGTLKDVKETSRAWNDAAMSRLQVSKAALAQLEKRLEARGKELDTANLAEDGALTELRASETDYNGKERQVNRAISDLKTLRAEIDLLAGQAERYEAELAELGSAKTCPTCGQPVKKANLAEHKRELTVRLEEIEYKIETKTELRKKWVKESEALLAMMARVESDKIRFRTKADNAGDEITRLRPEVESLKREIADAKKVKDEVNPHLETIKGLNERRKTLLGDLKEIEADIAKTQAKAERARYWVKGFKDIKLQLIEEIMSELELTVNSMIEEVGLEDWEVRCDIEKETKKGTVQRGINIQIASPESKGKLVRWECYSGGERQRLRLIGSLALGDVLLSRIGIETNLEILDEPSVYWSSEGVQELCELLSYRARERNKTIFYIEHNAVETSQFTDVMKIVKDKKGAYIA